MIDIVEKEIPGRIILNTFRSQKEERFGMLYSVPQLKQFFPDSSLCDVWDIYLDGGGKYRFPKEYGQDRQYSVLPLYNSVSLTINKEKMETLFPGQYYTLSYSDSSIFQIENEYPEEPACCLILVQKPTQDPSNAIIDIPLKINQVKNRLIDLNESISIGCFDCKEKQYLKMSSINKHFYFVIEGSFEIEDRLLGPRDSLVLWETENVEIESLSNNSILLHWKE